MSEGSRLQFFPITFFATVMGLTGFTIALGRFAEIFELHIYIYGLVKGLVFSVTAWYFFLISIYIAKYFKYPEEVKKDFNHPIKMNFIPTVSISLILLSIAYMNMSKTVSLIFWIVGSFLHLVLLLYIVNKWFFHDFKINFKNPAWFIPVIGPILVPISGVNFSAEISWFFFSIGIILWLPMLAILLYRLIFNDPMPVKLIPTLAILIAPPAVAFISYVKLTGGVDNFAKVLLYFGVFTFLLLLTFLNRFFSVPFFMSWWAYTFPMAAFTISVVLYYKSTNLSFFSGFAMVMLVLTFLVILTVAIKTIQAAVKGEICIEE